ncbi:Fc.00g063830.m01.CDS01 [Cosmosporella sp. VM-42]
MGRPRKRRHIEDEAPPLSQQTELMVDDFASFPNQLPFGGYDVPAQPILSMDPSLNFLDDSATSNMEFLDLLPQDYSQPIHHPEPQIFVPGETYDGPTSIPLSLSGVDLLGGINFDEPDPSQAAVSKDLTQSLHRYMVEHISQPLEPAESTPSDSTPCSDQSNASASPEPVPSTMRVVPTINCGCLSSLYLALDSLTHLPPDVMSAMRVARNASKTAHEVINCPTCSNPIFDDPTAPPPIQCFQNLMFLGALVPSACNAYAQILEMVDNETAEAKRQGRTFWFAFKDVGGLWGQVGEGSESCGVIQSYNNKSMPPDMWRLTIRALLRLDVYGLNEMKPGGAVAPATYCQQGLKDVVSTLEERSRKRHEMLDELVASGQIPQAGPYGVIYPNKPCPPSQRNCVKILETARIALDNLIIA